LPSDQLPFDGKQRALFHLLLELHFQLTDEVISLRFDFVLPGKQLPAQFATLAFQLTLLLLPRELFFEGW